MVVDQLAVEEENRLDPIFLLILLMADAHWQPPPCSGSFDLCLKGAVTGQVLPELPTETAQHVLFTTIYYYILYYFIPFFNWVQSVSPHLTSVLNCRHANFDVKKYSESVN